MAEPDYYNYGKAIREALEQAGTADERLEIRMGDVAEAVVAICELRGGVEVAADA